MRCEACGERKANVHMRRVVEGQEEERNLCEICASKMSEFGFMIEPTFSIQSLLSGLLNQASISGQQPVPRPARELACQQCGQTYGEFAKTGRLGCGNCYEEFQQALLPLIRRIQGGVVHEGKRPSEQRERLKVKHRIESLRQELGEAVDREDFERAAELRDKIRSLEKEAVGEGSREK